MPQNSALENTDFLRMFP